MHYARVSLYAMMLAAAGIPLYVHLPRFASVNLGIDLGTLGAVLLLIRIVDLVQDPLMGWAIDLWPSAQLGFGLAAAVGLALGFPMLFGAGPDTSLLSIVAILVLLFSAYSLGAILLYGRSATLATRPDEEGLLSVAAYREGGMLLGVVLATLAPVALVFLGAGHQGYPAFGVLMALVSLVIAVLTIPMWRRPVYDKSPINFSAFKNTGVLKLLLIALVNGLPVAITATLFLFFVEDRLKLAGMAGPLLLLFFICAGLSVPVWTAVAKRFGGRMTLLVAMPIAIAGFSWAAFLSEGDLWPFVVVCVISGMAIGADLVVLPAMFSIALAEQELNASAAFGFWSFAGKLGLALAAFLVLPMLERAGFTPGADNSADVLGQLTFAYAVVPCILKIAALAMVWTLPRRDIAS